jgi:hypothetical protein
MFSSREVQFIEIPSQDANVENVGQLSNEQPVTLRLIFVPSVLHRLLGTAVRRDSVTCFLPKWRHGWMFAAVVVTVRYLTHRSSPLSDISSQFRLGYLTNLVVKVTRKMGIMECKSVKVFHITFR